MSFDFAWPWMLWGLLLVVPVTWLHLHSRAGLPPGRARAVLFVRLLIVLCLVLALAGLRHVVPSDRLCVLFVVDASRSASDSQQDAARQFVARAMAGMRLGDQAGIVVFGRDAWFEAAPSEARPEVERPFGTAVERDYTDVGRALLLAQGAFPQGMRRRIVLLSDGNENVGDAAREAGVAGERGVSIWTVPYAGSSGGEVLVDRVAVPSLASREEPFDVRVHVRSRQAGKAILNLQRNGRLVGRMPVDLRSGENVLFVPQTLVDSGAYTYQASIEMTGDRDARNNQASGVTFVQGRPRVLYVSSAAGFAPDMLRAQGVSVDAVAPRRLPVRLSDLAAYTSLVLSDISALDMSENQMAMIAAYVKELGGGLVVLGGPNSFGVGGWNGTPVASVLPVLLDIRKRKYLPTVAVVHVLDKSGSMGEMAGAHEKIVVAREAAVASLDLLGERDELGVIGFDEAAKWVVDLQPAAGRAKMAEQIRTLRAGGGTDAYPAMVEALAALRSSKAVVKHMIVLSDGRTAPRDYDALLARILKAQVTVSTVSIGEGADVPFMERLARMGKGRSYVTNDAAMVPRIFSRDTVVASRSALVEEPFVPKLTEAHSILRGINSFATLRGYVMTSPRGNARTPLLTAQGDPLLASWRIGLGKSVAFTSDDGRRWAAAWSAVPSFFVQMVRWTFSDVERAPFRMQTEVVGGEVSVNVESFGERRNFLKLEASVIDPASEVRVVTLRQTGPGRYSARVPLNKIGPHVVSVVDRETGESRRAGVVQPYSPEFREDTPNVFLMNRVAALSGGKFEPRPEDVFRERGEKAYVATEAWERLALFALLLFPLDIALRRVFLPAGWAGKVGALASAWLPRRRAKTAVPADSTLAALKTRKKEVEERATLTPTASSPPVIIEAPILGPTREAPAKSAIEPGESTLEALKKARRERRGE